MSHRYGPEEPGTRAGTGHLRMKVTPGTRGTTSPPLTLKEPHPRHIEPVPAPAGEDPSGNDVGEDVAPGDEPLGIGEVTGLGGALPGGGLDAGLLGGALAGGVEGLAGAVLDGA